MGENCIASARANTTIYLKLFYKKILKIKRLWSLFEMLDHNL